MLVAMVSNEIIKLQYGDHLSPLLSSLKLSMEIEEWECCPCIYTADKDTVQVTRADFAMLYSQLWSLIHY